MCGGIAEQLNTDPTWIRLIWAAAALWKGMGAVAYVLAVLLIPSEAGPAPAQPAGRRWRILLGAVLLAGGLGWLLMREFNRLWFWMPTGDWWMPALLIAAGVMLMAVRVGAGAPEPAAAPPPAGVEVAPAPPSGLRRSRRERMILGVCGGIGVCYGIDPALVRLIWVVGTVLTDGLGLVVYLLMYLWVPQEDDFTGTTAPS